MAIQATFTADTRPLEQGMERVAASIAKTKRATGDADRSLKAMGSAFDGTRLEGTALRMAEGVRKVGGAAKLTADEFRRVERAVDSALDAIRVKGGTASATLTGLKRELDGLKSAATDGSKSFAGISLLQGAVAGLSAAVATQGLSAVRSLVSGVVESSGAIADLSSKTGLSTTEIQRLGYAAQQTGASVDTIAGAVSQLSKRLVEGGTGTVAAVAQLGLSFDELQRLSPAQAFEQIADAIARVPDPMQQTQLAMELFGRSGAEILPAIKAGIRDLGDEAERLGLVISDSAVRALDDFGDRWDRMALRAKTAAAGVIGDTLTLIDAISSAGSAAAKAIPTELADSVIGRRLSSAGPFGLGAASLYGLGTNFATKLLPFDGKLPEPITAPSRPVVNDADITRLLKLTEQAERATVKYGKAAAASAASVGKVSDAQRDMNRDVAKAYQVTAQATQGWEEYGGAIEEAATWMLAYAEANQTANLGTIKEASNPFNSIMNGPYFQQITDGAPRQAAATARSWQQSMRGVVQAFASLAQIAGPSLDGVTRGLGTVIASADASTQLVEALGERFSGLTDKASGNLSAGGRALSGGLAGLTTGLQIGGLFTNRGAGFAAGAVSGAATGAMAGGFIGAGVGAVVGGLAGLYSANQNRKAQAQQMEAMRQQVIASYGTLDDFKRVVERTGYSWEYFTSLFNSNKPETFQRAVTSLNTAIAEQKSRADKLVVSLNKVAAAQGALSQSQLAQMRLTRPGDPGYDEINQFLEGQVAQAETGIVAAVDALGRYTGNALQDFGGSVNAAAAGLAALFGEAVARGESAVQIIGRLGGAMGTLQGIYERNGGTMPTGLAGISDLAGIVNGQNTGIAVQTASGLGSALAGFQNTGVFAAMPELFTDIANGIGSAWRALEQFGGGGQRGLAIFAPYLQTLWEILDANPQLRSQLDEQTRSLLELAEANGVVGAAQRDAAEKQIEAIDRLIAKLDEWLSKLGQVANAPMPSGPAAPPTGTGTPGGGNSGSGGDYDGFAIGSGGVRDFGRESLVRLHGREAVLTEAQYNDLQARARKGVRMSAPAWGGSMRVEAPVYLNARRVGLGVAEVTPGLLQTYGVR
jgi:gas vesicle protein